MAGLGAEEAVIDAQQPVGEAGRGGVDDRPDRDARDRRRHGTQKRAEGQIDHRGDDRAVAEQEDDELRLRETEIHIGRDEALRRAGQRPEIGELVGFLAGTDQRRDECDGRPVAQIHRQFVAEAQPAARDEEHVPGDPGADQDGGEEIAEHGVGVRRGARLIPIMTAGTAKVSAMTMRC